MWKKYFNEILKSTRIDIKNFIINKKINESTNIIDKFDSWSSYRINKPEPSVS